MKFSAILSTVCLLLAGESAARKSCLVKSEHRGKIPSVGATDYPEQKIFENYDDSFIVYYQAKVEIGWEWDDPYEQDPNGRPYSYHLSLSVVSKQSAYFSPLLNMPRFLYLEPVWEVPTFSAGEKVDFAYLWDHDNGRQDKLCFSTMLSVDEIKPKGTLIMRFQECYKTLWNCIYNFNNWTDKDAKYFESCS